LSLTSRRPSRLRSFLFFRLLLSTAYRLSSGRFSRMGPFCFALSGSRTSLSLWGTVGDIFLLLATSLWRGPLRTAALLGTLRRLCRLFRCWLLFFLFLLRSARGKRNRKTAHQSKKYSHKLFHCSRLDIPSTSLIQRPSAISRMPLRPN